MATEHKEVVSSEVSSDTDNPKNIPNHSDKASTPSETNQANNKEGEDYENLNYPAAWKFEKWFLGGYSQSRMIKFKNPKTMYKAINLFAGKVSPHPRREESNSLIRRLRCCYHVLWI